MMMNLHMPYVKREQYYIFLLLLPDGFVSRLSAAMDLMEPD